MPYQYSTQPSTPPRNSSAKLPFTPITPSEGRSDATIIDHHNSKTQRVITKTPQKAQEYNGAHSLITPDFTPKMRKRKDMFDALVADIAKTKSKSASVKSKLLMRAPEVSPTNDVSSTEPVISEELEKEGYETECGRSLVVPNHNIKTHNRHYSHPPSTPPSRSIRSISFSKNYGPEPATPSSKIVHTRAVAPGEEYVPHYTLSSPSVFKKKGSHNIFDKTKNPSSAKSTQLGSDGESDIEKENSQKKEPFFNPHKEVLLINKNGNKVIKQFDMSDPFNRNFKPKNLLSKLVQLNKTYEAEKEDEKDRVQKQKEKEAADDEFVKKLLEEEGESSDEEYFRKTVVRRRMHKNVFGNMSTTRPMAMPTGLFGESRGKLPVFHD